MPKFSSRSHSSYEAKYNTIVDFGKGYRSYGTYKTFPERESSGPTNSGDFYSDSRDYSKSVKNTMRKLATASDTVTIVDKFLEDNGRTCIKSLEDGVKGIESAVSLLDRKRVDLEALNKKVKFFVDVKEPKQILRETIGLIKLLQPFYNIYSYETDLDLDKLRCLSGLLDVLNSKQNKQKSAPAPTMYSRFPEKTDRVISAVTSFLEGLRRQLTMVLGVCMNSRMESERKINANSILAIGDFTDDIADLYVALVYIFYFKASAECADT